MTAATITYIPNPRFGPGLPEQARTKPHPVRPARLTTLLRRARQLRTRHTARKVRRP